MSDLQIINGPLSLYWAPVGEAFPLVDTAPAGNWVLIGTSGDENYTEDGVVISPSQTIETFTPLGLTAPNKAFRTNEELIVSVTIVDLSLANYRLALNQNAITATASGVGIPGQDAIDLNRGADVNTIALLVRGTGKSPQTAGLNLQFQLNKVYEAGAQELTFVKGEPVGVLLEFHALHDGTAVGKLINQTAAAS